jgi:hypothetical protein
MKKLSDLLSIDNFSIEKIDISDIEEVMSKLPKNGIIDLNIAEQCMILTLEGQNLCQEKIVVLDRWIGHLESEKNRSWSNATLNKSKVAGHKTAKDKEWFAQGDDDYINICNQLTLARACKKWFENKAGYFSGWHYALKTFLKRDYGIENASGIVYGSASNAESFPTKYASHMKDDEEDSDDMAEDIEWG